MSKKNKAKFKNEYTIDMNKLAKQPTSYTLNGVLLPIEKINGADVTEKSQLTKLFAERPALRMVEQYSVLFPMMNRDARTIIEYVAKDGHALITLFPNADLDIHDKNWQEHLTENALADLLAIYNKRKSAYEGMRGAIQSVLHK